MNNQIPKEYHELGFTQEQLITATKWLKSLAGNSEAKRYFYKLCEINRKFVKNTEQYYICLTYMKYVLQINIHNT